jgi:hypothetical protein
MIAYPSSDVYDKQVMELLYKKNICNAVFKLTIMNPRYIQTRMRNRHKCKRELIDITIIC